MEKIEKSLMPCLSAPVERKGFEATPAEITRDASGVAPSFMFNQQMSCVLGCAEDHKGNPRATEACVKRCYG